ncbi:hypothetical protein OS493_033572 [Desmophyllum pertusum]|uniref:Uncharacterized protein n=1 Tax=Desmophyllum pertusum TaxID=174260 RepID=A0A9X0CNH1_9CNID|nr:hypothetical protein OS493_033572 [Desmophyllum pertusum]
MYRVYGLSVSSVSSVWASVYRVYGPQCIGSVYQVYRSVWGLSVSAVSSVWAQCIGCIECMGSVYRSVWDSVSGVSALYRVYGLSVSSVWAQCYRVYRAQCIGVYGSVGFAQCNQVYRVYGLSVSAVSSVWAQCNRLYRVYGSVYRGYGLSVSGVSAVSSVWAQCIEVYGLSVSSVSAQCIEGMGSVYRLYRSVWAQCIRVYGPQCIGCKSSAWLSVSGVSGYTAGIEFIGLSVSGVSSVSGGITWRILGVVIPMNALDPFLFGNYCTYTFIKEELKGYEMTLKENKGVLKGLDKMIMDSLRATDPELVEGVLKSLYVDDYASGSSFCSFCSGFVKKVKSRLAEGGFNMRKWTSNSKEIVQSWKKSRIVLERRNSQSKKTAIAEEDQG